MLNSIFDLFLFAYYRLVADVYFLRLVIILEKRNKIVENKQKKSLIKYNKEFRIWKSVVFSFLFRENELFLLENTKKS